jgi:predicted Zn-dependent protease
MPIAPGSSPQAAAWSRIDRDPVGWPAEVRKGVLAAIDQLAWTGILVLPEVLQELHDLALGLARDGSPSQAVAVADVGLRLAPADPRLHAARGTALLAHDRPAEAVPALRRALELDPSRVNVHAQLGQALARQGRLDEAIDAVRTAVALKPDAPHYRVQLGRLLVHRGELDAAEGTLREVLGAGPLPDVDRLLDQIERRRAPQG